MAEIEVKNLANEVVGKLELSDAVFKAEFNQPLIWEAVKHYNDSLRSGTASTKVRGEVSGSGKKLWRQKGNGARARRQRPESFVAARRYGPWSEAQKLYLPFPAQEASGRPAFGAFRQAERKFGRGSRRVSAGKSQDQGFSENTQGLGLYREGAGGGFRA